MGKLIDRLQKQLQTSEHKKDAEDCIKLYNWLQKNSGHVWSSQWSFLVDVKFRGFPSDERIFKPSFIGYAVLKSLEK